MHASVHGHSKDLHEGNSVITSQRQARKACIDWKNKRSVYEIIEQTKGGK